MIKAILLDMGGVIINLDISRSIRAYKEDLGFRAIEDFLDPCHQKGFIGQLEGGEITPAEFFEKVKQYCDPGVTDEQITSCQSALLLDIDPSKAVYLRALSERYPLFMLSNNNRIVFPRCCEIFAEAGIPVEEIFKELYLSCDMKLLKPGREIYEQAVSRTGYAANELLFIDDSKDNVEAARSVGINAALYRQGEDLETLIESEIQKADRI